MIFLEPGSKVIETHVRERLLEGKRDVGMLDLSVSDFDGVAFLLNATKGEPGTGTVCLTLQMRVPNYAAQLVPLGVDAVLDKALAGIKIPPPQPADFDVAVQVNTAHLPHSRFSTEDLVRVFANLRTIVQGVPLRRTLTDLAHGKSSSGKSSPPPKLPPPASSIVRYDYRGPPSPAPSSSSATATPNNEPQPTEALFLCQQADRLLVTFALDFKDDMDQAMARVLLQEFVETQRTINGVPHCAYSRTLPLELQSLGLGCLRPVVLEGETQEEEGIAGFLTFAVFPSHVQGDGKDETAAKIERVVGHLMGFRSFLHYHIKASKTYLHTRMRFGADRLLERLSRAIPQVDTTTTTGKTWTRPPA